MTLRSLPTTPHFSTSTHKLLDALYIPALERAISYDRGVGYFTSNWLKMAASGIAALARNGGKVRMIASPILNREDSAALNEGADARNDPALRQALELAIADLERDLSDNTLSALAWMTADGLLDFRIAIPTLELDGDFHDKFGIFRDAVGDAVAFHGSPNDSAKAFRNYESISVYYTWVDGREAQRVEAEQARFDLLWNNRDANVRIYELPDAVRRNFIEFAGRTECPYDHPVSKKQGGDSRWRHQHEAMASFLKAKHGILEMATGTGKTRTALAISDELLERDLINTVVVTAHGTDLLDQWHRQLVKQGVLPVYRAYEKYHEAQSYLNHPDGSILLISRQHLAAVLPRLRTPCFEKALIVCDEVHGLGSPALVASLSGKLQPFAYRLGLSATPDREYDQDGNRFIEDEIGPVIFEFGLKDAIREGILCGFDYIELPYDFSDEDRAAIRQAVRRYHAKVSAGDAPAIEALYQDIARIRKLSKEKLPPFDTYAHAHRNSLQRSLIFVETAEYGLYVQNILMELHIDYHTYYGDDERSNLVRFANGELDCLITCHRISEGIDIQSVNTIVLFASARARLETVQRLGRCLRTDPANPGKRATVIDFIRVEDDAGDDHTGELSADEDRRDWFRDIAAVSPSTPIANRRLFSNDQPEGESS
ncbi:DEAD/DEAH box helicase family protein [Sinorhizobium sp. 8-89]|uniref:DEAD/DEAH box helicase family protein n=1 Tax=Sinorhizobium sp. 7-81 TaxID=3049087 RepID=UPI0024C25CA8|nr:DEAD/DEAH box helicase family protein [Sinorhizobium sp. 7-81]MDK1389900.1 DEAD/DEAH box helicase family protein [Sinorhizobium sp. 7-81]